VAGDKRRAPTSAAKAEVIFGHLRHGWKPSPSPLAGALVSFSFDGKDFPTTPTPDSRTRTSAPHELRRSAGEGARATRA
jgi:hypothetical protein